MGAARASLSVFLFLFIYVRAHLTNLGLFVVHSLHLEVESLSELDALRGLLRPRPTGTLKPRPLGTFFIYHSKKLCLDALMSALVQDWTSFGHQVSKCSEGVPPFSRTEGAGDLYPPSCLENLPGVRIWSLLSKTAESALEQKDGGGGKFRGVLHVTCRGRHKRARALTCSL